jgi:hypothetical protein
MSNLNDVYLHNYQVLDYGLICKNKPKWGLVLLASGPVAILMVELVTLVSSGNEAKKMSKCQGLISCY